MVSGQAAELAAAVLRLSLKNIAQTRVYAQAMLGSVKVGGINGRENYLEVPRIIEKTHVVLHFQERGDTPGEPESHPGSKVQAKLCAGAKFCGLNGSGSHTDGQKRRSPMGRQIVKDVSE
jgi:hypothetical protein